MFWACTFAAIPFSILAAILALFNIVPVQFNGVDTYGWKATIIIILYLPFWSLIFGGLTWMVLNFGNLLHNEFLKLIKKKHSNSEV